MDNEFEKMFNEGEAVKPPSAAEAMTAARQADEAKTNQEFEDAWQTSGEEGQK